MLVPVPDVITLSGERVRVHVPDEGRPEMMTLPVAREHVGWVTVPGTGAEGIAGGSLITTFADDVEAQPPAFSTLKVYVP